MITEDYNFGIETKFGEHIAKPVTWDNMQFPSLQALGRYLGTSPQALRYHLKKGSKYGGSRIIHIKQN